eukprot:177503-Chlamydomonas_euryale.AAC.1
MCHGCVLQVPPRKCGHSCVPQVWAHPLTLRPLPLTMCLSSSEAMPPPSIPIIDGLGATSVAEGRASAAAVVAIAAVTSVCASAAPGSLAYRTACVPLWLHCWLLPGVSLAAAAAAAAIAATMAASSASPPLSSRRRVCSRTVSNWTGVQQQSRGGIGREARDSTMKGGFKREARESGAPRTHPHQVDLDRGTAIYRKYP